MAREFSRAMNNAADDAGVGDISSTIRSAANPLKSSVDAVKNAATDYATYDPETETGRLAAEMCIRDRKIREHAEKKAKDNLHNEKVQNSDKKGSTKRKSAKAKKTSSLKD